MVFYSLKNVQKVQSALLGTSDFLQLYLYISTKIMWQIEDKKSWSILAYTPTLLRLSAAYRPCTLLWSLKQPPSVLSYWVDTWQERQRGDTETWEWDGWSGWKVGKTTFINMAQEHVLSRTAYISILPICKQVFLTNKSQPWGFCFSCCF